MRAIWSGQISFGLVTVPVKAYGAAEKHEVAFHQVHDADGGRIKYERRCEVCGKKVAYAEIDKAYDDGDRTVVITEEDFASLPAEQKDEIEVVQFVPGDQIDPIMLDTPYFLEPTGKLPKSYVLLRRTLEKSELTAIVRFTLRSKTRLGVLRARGDLIVLQTLTWPEAMREPDAPAGNVTVSAKEEQMSAALVDQFAGDFHPDDFSDDYQEQLRQLIDAKLAQGDSVDSKSTFGDAAGEAGGGKVLSLLEALEGSLAARAGSPVGGSSGSGDDAAKGANRGTAGSKSAATGSAAKKSAAARTTAKKSAAPTRTTAKKSDGPAKGTARKATPKKSA